MSEELFKQKSSDLNDSDSETSSATIVNKNTEKRTYSIEDIQRILDISKSTTYLLVKKKLFRSVKIGNQIRISKSSFDTWLDVG